MAKKNTAHRPSQSHMEYVTTKDGRKVKNTAYVPTKKGAKVATPSPSPLPSNTEQIATITDGTTPPMGGVVYPGISKEDQELLEKWQNALAHGMNEGEEFYDPYEKETITPEHISDTLRDLYYNRTIDTFFDKYKGGIDPWDETPYASHGPSIYAFEDTTFTMRQKDRDRFYGYQFMRSTVNIESTIDEDVTMMYAAQSKFVGSNDARVSIHSPRFYGCSIDTRGFQEFRTEGHGTYSFFENCDIIASENFIVDDGLFIKSSFENLDAATITNSRFKDCELDEAMKKKLFNQGNTIIDNDVPYQG